MPLNADIPSDTRLHRIVIVGGGAGGLELATRLGDRLGRCKKAHVTLIERARTHFWKPHLHEVAAGSMDIGVYETNYLAQAIGITFVTASAKWSALIGCRRWLMSHHSSTRTGTV
jgi:NADH dehydrogenase FAD-containing subunit